VSAQSPFKEWQPIDMHLPYVDFSWVGGEHIVFAKEVMRPGGGGPLHRHFKAEELIFVAEGEVEIIIGDETRTLVSGEVAIFPRGVFHGVHTPTGATFYITFSPTQGELPTDDYERMDGRSATDPV
jgi:quercetin dioxygenase-like cupin family protein